MMALTHALAGVGSAVAISAATGHELTPVAISLVALGSLFPDIDDPQSWLGRRIWPVAFVVSTAVRHRGFTHSLLGALLIVGGLGFALHTGYQHALFFLYGYFSHLVADFFSNSGIPFLWPSQRRFRFIWTIHTGGLLERLVCLGIGGYFVFDIYKYLGQIWGY